jgi:amino acid adenylation domain-containing protein
MPNAAERLAALSPAKRALLQARLEQRPASDGPQPRPDGGPAPLSFAQQRLWLLDQLHPGLSAYNQGRALRLHGPLDVAALEMTLTELVARHEVLRTAFVMEGDAPLQRVLAAAPVRVHVADVAAGDLERIAMEAINQPFDLTAGAPLRSHLLRLAPDDHVLVLVTHHIASDEGSKGVLYHELAELYNAFLAGRESPLAPLPLQYADYAVWERRRAEQGAHEAELAWWRVRLDGAPIELDLPTDRSRAPVPTYSGARLAEMVDPALLDGLRAIGRQEGATLFMVLAAAFGTLVARLSGQDDLLIGTPATGRVRPELEGLMGVFANTAILRVSIEDDPTFLELLRRTREMVAGALLHELPLDRLVEEFVPDRELARNPLFQVLFSFHENPAEDVPAMAGLEVEPVRYDPGVAKLDLSVEAAVRPDGLRLGWEYSGELFDAGSVARISAQLRTLLASVAADPAARVSELEIASPAEREALERFNATAAPIPGDCLHELFAAQAEQRADTVAVACGGRSLTYAELDERSNRLAHELRAAGVVPGTLVGLYLDRSVELFVGLLGVLKAGGAYVPLDPSYPADRLAFQVQDAQAPVVVTTLALAAEAPAGEARVVALDDPALAALPATAPAPLATPRDLAYVIYTSGSTGKPKGVMIEHRSVVNLLESMAVHPGLAAGETMVGVTTFAFDLSVPDLYLPLTTGATLVMARPDEAGDPRALAALIDDSGATVMQATPSTWRMLLDDGWTPRRGMRIVIGGEAVPADIAARLRDVMDEVWNFYGPTETTVWSTCWRVGEVGSTVPVGTPIANTTILIADRAGNPAPAGALGELCIGGAGVARGYLHRPELTAERFVADGLAAGERMYRTGDVARLRPDGLLEFVGRRDHQVKVRGFRIELGEIETLLAERDDVRQAVAIVREDEPGAARLVAYVVGDADEAELQRHLAALLPAHMVPSAIVTLERLPLTPNGKLDRKGLPVPERDPERGVVAPRTPVEEWLADLWKQVLAVDTVSIDDNFFHLGGHSLLVARVIARVRQEFGVDIPLRRLWESPTIAELSQAITAGLLDGDLDELLAELDDQPELA